MKISWTPIQGSKPNHSSPPHGVYILDACKCISTYLLFVYLSGMHGAQLLGHGVGWGKGESLLGGAGRGKNQRGGAKKVRKSTDL